MKQPEITEAPTCPSCGAPRLAHAWDCGKCGAVFDGETSAPEVEESPSANGAGTPSITTPVGSSSARRTSSARRPGSARRSPAHRVQPPDLTVLREWVAENKTVVVILSFVFYVAVVWLFGALIIGATDSSGAIKRAYRDVTGRPLPDGFGPTFAAHFVSRRLVVLDRPDQVMLVLYRDEDGATDGKLRSFAEGALDLFEVPWERIRTRNAKVAGEAIEVEVFRLFGEGGPHLYLLPTATTDGGRAMEAVVGPPETVFDVVEEMMADR